MAASTTKRGAKDGAQRSSMLRSGGAEPCVPMSTVLVLPTWHSGGRYMEECKPGHSRARGGSRHAVLVVLCVGVRVSSKEMV